MQRLLLSAPLTHSDWMLKPDGPARGLDGVRHMLTRCREFGLDRVYWRCYDCGRSTYSSELIEPFRWSDHDEVYQYSPGYIPPPAPEIMAKCEALDYTTFDSLAAAVEIGHALGLQVWGWMTVNEDDHGLGWPSRFARQHPEYRWVRRNGEMYHSQLSFAHSEVRAYKLGLVREVLSYDVDGILLDWIRTGDIRDNPQTDDRGYADHGYEEPNVASFRARYGLDPHAVAPGDARWLAACAEPITEYMRGVRRLVQARARPTGSAAMVQHPWAYRGILPEQITPETPQWVRNMRGNRYAGALEGLLCDIKAWAREGLVDGMLASGYYAAGGTPELAYQYMRTETEGRIPLTLYAWVPQNADDLSRDLAIAERCGASELLFWEADYIDSRTPEQFAAIRAGLRGYRASDSAQR